VNAPLSLGQRTDGLLALSLTHYKEVCRQPLYGVVLLTGLSLVGISPALSVFSLGKAEGFVLDLGASTMLFFAVFLAATAVAASTADRLNDGTTTLILTRPIGPGGLLIAALLGGGLALGRACLLLGVALFSAVRLGPHGLHAGVLASVPTAGLLALGYGVWATRRDRPFQPAALDAATLLMPLGCLLGLCFNYILEPVVPTSELRPDLATAMAAAWLAYVAGFAFCGLGLCLATRLPSEAAASLTLVGFVLASLVQAGLGRGSTELALWLGVALCLWGGIWSLVNAFRDHLAWGLGLILAPSALVAVLMLFGTGLGPALLIGQGALWLAILWFALLRWSRGGLPLLVYTTGLLVKDFGGVILEGGVLTLLLPDLQLFWVADAAYSGDLVPFLYVAQTTLYAVLYAGGTLSVGAFLLHGRELGN
jgi:hypothetical protein